MTFRTPIPQFIAIDFMNNGEILNAANLNDRMLHKLDDKSEFLRSNLDVEVTKSTRIADLVGEDYDGIETTPCWTTNHNFTSTATHHLAIEGLDTNLSRVDASSTDQTNRLANNDVYVGEDSNTPGTPTWLTPNAFPLGSNHHAAIQGLDDYAKVTRNTTDSLTAGQDILDIQMLTRIGEIGGLTTDLGALQAFTGQTGVAGHESKLIVHTSDIAALSLLTSTGPLGSQVAENETDITALETLTGVTGHTSQIGTLRTEMDTVFLVAPGTHASKIAALEASIGIINTTYATQLNSILTHLGSAPTSVLGPFTLPTV